MTGAGIERRAWRPVFAGGLAVWVVTTAIYWIAAAPLGHDEAQYAIAGGGDTRWFYVPTGMTAIAAPGILAGGSELALRFVPALLGIAFILAIAAVARRSVGVETAGWSVALLAGAQPIAKRSAELLSDMPAATALLVAVALVITELEREDGPRWRLVLVAPLFAAALYVRYASCVPIAIVALAALGFGWRAILRRPWPVVATVLAFVALLVPHARNAIAETGSPLGILLDSSAQPGREYLGAGLVGYITKNPFVFYGALLPPALVAGLLAIGRRSADRARLRRIRFLWVVAVTTIVAIGLTTHAQARYVMFPLALLVLLGVDGLRTWIDACPPRPRAALGWVAAIAVAGACIAVLVAACIQRTTRVGRMAGTLAAVTAIKRDAAGAPCQVLGVHTTQLEWYSGCFATWDTPVDAIARGEPVYAVTDNTGGPQPVFADLPGRHRTILDVPGVVQVIRLAPAQ